MSSIKCSSLEVTPITFAHNSFLCTNCTKPRLHPITRRSINAILTDVQRYLVSNSNDYHTWFRCLSMAGFTQGKDMRRGEPHREQNRVSENQTSKHANID